MLRGVGEWVMLREEGGKPEGRKAPFSAGVESLYKIIQINRDVTRYKIQ